MASKQAFLDAVTHWESMIPCLGFKEVAYSHGVFMYLKPHVKPISMNVSSLARFS